MAITLKALNDEEVREIKLQVLKNLEHQWVSAVNHGQHPGDYLEQTEARIEALQKELGL
jgi:uncharacterized protein (UPF0276 family)